MATRLPLPLPGSPPQGFPTLHRPRDLLRLPSLRRDWSPLRRPCGPPLGLPLRRTLQPDFPAFQRSSSLPQFSPHGGPPAPAFSVAAEVASPTSSPPAAAPPGLPSSLLSSVASTVAVISLPASLSPIAVTASSFDADSSVSSPPHSALLSKLSSVSLPPVRYFPPAPAFVMCSDGSSDCPRHHVAVAIVSVASVIPRPSLSVPLVFPFKSLFYLPAPLPPPSAVSRDPAASRPAPCTSSPGPGHQYPP